MSIDAMVADLEKLLNPGTPVKQIVKQLKAKGYTCHDETKTAVWTQIKPSKTTGCTIFISQVVSGVQIDVALPEDKGGGLIMRGVINKRRIGI